MPPSTVIDDVSTSSVEQQAKELPDFVSNIEQIDSKASVIVLGDLNDFQFSEPLSILEGPGPVLVDLVNALPEKTALQLRLPG
jgi:predicted extracellular nuclease